MADSVVLSVSQSQSVAQLLQLAEQRERSTRRLSTGQEVSSIRDNPQNYLRASALTQQANGFLDAKAEIGLAIDSLSATGAGLDAVERLGEQLKGLAIAAQSADAGTRAELAAQFDVTRQQLDLLANDASFLGTNLLSTPADNLNVSVSPAPGTELTAEGRATSSAGLGIGDAASYASFATAADVESALSDLNGAIATVRTSASSFANDAAILNVREEFSQNIANVLQDGAAKLTDADLTAEAASLLTNQTRDALAREGLRITGQSQSQLADLIAA
jgi:flagellin